MSEEFIANQLANLQIEEQRLDALKNIKRHVTEVAVPQKEPIFSRLLVLLDSLEDRDASSEQTHLTCDILCLCMANLEIDSSEWCYYSYLERCLQYKNNDVQLLALTDMERRINDHLNGNSAIPLGNLYRTQTLMDIVACFANEATKDAMVAANILLRLLPTAANDYAAVKLRLESCLEQKDKIRCRVYDFGVKLSLHSPDMHHQYQFILDKLCAELIADSGDVLLYVTLLKIAADIGTTEHGYIYLENQGVFAKLMQRISTLDEDQCKRILLPSYLSFFGSIAADQPAKVIQNFPEFLHVVFRTFFGKPEVMQEAVATLCVMARSSEGKILLDGLYRDKLHKAFLELGRYMPCLPTDLKVCMLESLNGAFECDAQDVHNNQIGSITLEWFACLADETEGLTFISNFCRNPFPDLKLPALTLLRTVCRYPWGPAALNATAGFIEYLLDRSAEFDKNVLLAKYEVLKDLTTSGAFNANIHEQINTYVQEGAFVVRGTVDVAVGSD